MTTQLNIPRGIRITIPFSFWESDDTTPIDITDSTLRLHVKCTADDPPAEALFRLASYEGEITITGTNTAEAVLEHHHTRDLDAGDYFWDLVPVLRGSQHSQAGSPSAAVATGSRVITLTDTDLSAVQVGDLISLSGGSEAENNIQAPILAIDTDAGTVTTDYDDFVTETGLTVALYEENTLGPMAEHRGVFRVLGTVTR